MSDEREPIRLLDPASGASEAVREVLGSARADGPTEADLRRLGARVAALGEPPPPGGGSGGAPILPVALIAAGIATLVAGWVFWARPPAPRDLPAPRASPARVDPPATTGPAPAPSAMEPPPPSTAPAPSAGPPLPPPRAVATHRSPSHEARAPETHRPATVPAEAAEAAESTEIDLLGAAQRALRNGAPRRALELAQEHAVRFPAGMLVEEREAIAVEALARQARGAEAALRYAAFVRRFPRSTYRARLQKLVAR